jgi:hypothetical protein
MKKVLALALALSAAAALAVSASATGKGSSAAAVVVKHAPPARLVTHSLTLNWAGYASYGAPSPLTNVQGSWTQPTASCSSQTTYAAFWVGIDGYDSSSVEQTGTDADCSKGVPVYYAWYEMYPALPVDLPTSSYPVQPNDVLTASVDALSGLLTISDTTQGWTFHTTQSFTGDALSSAEWIAEAPSLCSPGSCKVAPLTNFGTVNFSGASANGKAIDYRGWSNDPMTMVTGNGRTVMAAPSSLSDKGSAFSVTWSHS